MTLATLKGRMQTKVLTYIVVALVTVVFAVAYKSLAFFDLFFIAVLVGLAWEAIWGVFITHQQGWTAFAFGAIEFFYITVFAMRLHVDVAFSQATVFYLVAWVLVQLFLIYILPIWRISWADDGSELW